MEEKNDNLVRDEKGNIVLKKDGTPRKKGGRPKGSKSVYNFSNAEKTKMAARKAVKRKEDSLKKLSKKLVNGQNQMQLFPLVHLDYYLQKFIRNVKIPLEQ